MQRSAFKLLAAITLLTTVAGCSSLWPFGKKDKTADVYDPSGGAPVTDPYANSYATAPIDSGTYAPTGGGSRYHTVQKKETLYSISRQYYAGDASRWKDIYAANRSEIGDPNKIRVGQRLMIP